MSKWGNIFVPNEISAGNTILLVGEAPGAEEEIQERPFAPNPNYENAGVILENVLTRNGVKRGEQVGFANLFNYRPFNNRFELLFDGGVPCLDLQSSVSNLLSTIEQHKETLKVIVPLGNWPLYFLTHKNKFRLVKGQPKISGILNWRGSILSGPSEIKTIPTIHPAAVLRERTYYPTFDSDIQRVVDDSNFRELKLPTRNLVVLNEKNLDELEAWTVKLLAAEHLSVDIENVKASTKLLCVGFSPSPDVGVCFAYNDSSATIRDCLQRLLGSSITKVFHFGTHDTEILRLNGYEVNNYRWDTLIAQHVMWPELPRSLAYLTSTYTREPYYKDEAKEEDSDAKSWSLNAIKKDITKLYRYNCKDVCVTIEIYLKQKEEIKRKKEWIKFVEFELSLLRPAHSIMQNGLLVDEERRSLIDKAIGLKLKEAKGALASLLNGYELNVYSHINVKKVLFDILKLPKRTKIDKTSEEGSKLTADEDALISLIAVCKDKIDTLKRAESKVEWQHKFLILKLIILIRSLRKKKSSYVDFNVSPDGRVRSRVKVAATETGRWAMEKYVDATGVNSQTFPRESIELSPELEKELAK